MGQDLKPSISCMDKGKICKYMEQDGKCREIWKLICIIICDYIWLSINKHNAYNYVKQYALICIDMSSSFASFITSLSKKIEINNRSHVVNPQCMCGEFPIKVSSMLTHCQKITRSREFMHLAVAQGAVMDGPSSTLTIRSSISLIYFLKKNAPLWKNDK